MRDNPDNSTARAGGSGYPSAAGAGHDCAESIRRPNVRKDDNATVAEAASRQSDAPIVIAFVMPVATDPRINRRVQAAASMGCRTTIFSFDRDYFDGSQPGDSARVISLGRIAHGKYLQRIRRLPTALLTLLQHRTVLWDADVIYAFGPDCFVLSVVASLLLPMKRRRIIYELADVRRIMLEASVKGMLLRWVERVALKSAEHVVITSEAYRDNYVCAMQHFPPQLTTVLENKLTPPLPAPIELPPHPSGRMTIRIGWFGLLRFAESWELLVRIAEEYPDRISVYVRGYPISLPDFAFRVQCVENIRYGGSYSSPGDLAQLYAEIDVSWVVYGVGTDRQRQWMLPNRFFEAIYYRVPIIAARGSLLAERVEELGIGWAVDVDKPEQLVASMAGITWEKIQQARARLSDLRRDYAIGSDENLELIRRLVPASEYRSARRTPQ